MFSLRKIGLYLLVVIVMPLCHLAVFLLVGVVAHGWGDSALAGASFFAGLFLTAVLVPCSHSAGRLLFVRESWYTEWTGEEVSAFLRRVVWHYHLPPLSGLFTAVLASAVMGPLGIVLGVAVGWGAVMLADFIGGEVDKGAGLSEPRGEVVVSTEEAERLMRDLPGGKPPQK